MSESVKAFYACNKNGIDFQSSPIFYLQSTIDLWSIDCRLSLLQYSVHIKQFDIPNYFLCMLYDNKKCIIQFILFKKFKTSQMRYALESYEMEFYHRQDSLTSVIRLGPENHRFVCSSHKGKANGTEPIHPKHYKNLVNYFFLIISSKKTTD